LYYQYDSEIPHKTRALTDFPNVEVDILNDNCKPLDSEAWIAGNVSGPTNPGYEIINLVEPAVIPVDFKQYFLGRSEVKDGIPVVKGKKQILTDCGALNDLVFAHTDLPTEEKRQIQWKLNKKNLLIPKTNFCLIHGVRHSAQDHSCLMLTQQMIYRMCINDTSQKIPLDAAIHDQVRNIIQVNMKIDIQNLNIHVRKDDESANLFQILQKEIWANGKELSLRRIKGNTIFFQRVYVMIF